jgi:hypothetical protein
LLINDNDNKVLTGNYDAVPTTDVPVFPVRVPGRPLESSHDANKQC